MIKFKSENGITIETPTSMSELRLTDYHDFITTLRNCGIIVNEDEEQEKKLNIDVYPCIAKALSFVVNGNIQNLPISTKDKQTSLLGLFDYVVDLLVSYKPTKKITPGIGYWFEWEGDVYGITPERAKSYLLNIAYTANEAVELLESDRLLAQKIAESSDPDGVFAYEMDLRKVAVLCRKENEDLPLDADERAMFIDKRCKLFENIPASIALDMRFFFIATLTQYLTAVTQEALQEA